jgi:glycerophosphoryl diester phosphodiesterase
MAAFKRAIEDGADGIELDVRLAKDSVPVIFHDSTLERMAQKKIRTSQFTSAELRALDIGRWFNARHSRKASDKFLGETVPTLAEVFDFLRGYKGRIYVELKGKTDEMFALVETVARAVRQTNLLPNIILKSFKLEAVAQAKKIFPEAATAALFAPKIMTILHKQSRLIQRAKDCRADQLSLHYSLATQKLIEMAASENLPITIWTVDRPAWVRRARTLGIKAIITNNPARLIAERHAILRNSAKPL